MDEKVKATGGTICQRYKKLYLWIVFGLIIVAVITYFSISAYLSAPQDLGSDLVYIGQDGYGCSIGFCDSPPTFIYYFATNMSISSLKSFIMALGYTYDATDSNEYNGNAALYFYGPPGNSGLDINYYSDQKSARDSTRKPLQPTNKKYAISMLDDTYTRLRQSLQKAGKL